MITQEDFEKLIPAFRAQGCTCAPSFVIDWEQKPPGDHGYVVHHPGCPLDRGDAVS